MAKVRLSDLDNPLMFVLAMTIVIMTMTYLLGWGFHALGWEGPAQITKGYGVR